MEDRLREARERHDDLSTQLADPGIHADPKRLRDLSREHSTLAQVVEAAARLDRARSDLDGARALLAESEGDPEMAAMAKAEIEQLTADVERLETELKALLSQDDLSRYPTAANAILRERWAAIGPRLVREAARLPSMSPERMSASPSPCCNRQLRRSSTGSPTATSMARS